MSQSPADVLVHRPVSRLSDMVDADRGLTYQMAVHDARANLSRIRRDCLLDLDRRLNRLTAFQARDPDMRPDNMVFDALRQNAEAALTACGALDMIELGKALTLLCAQCDALQHADRWPRDALAPAINLIVLFRAGHVTGPDAEAMMEGLRRCLALYQTYAAPTDD